jgi:hypothetical protein
MRRVIGDAIGLPGTAAQAAVHDYQPLARAVLEVIGPHEPVATGRTISRSDIDVLRPQARRTVVAVAAVGERRDRVAAVLAREALILGGPADGSASGLKK